MPFTQITTYNQAKGIQNLLMARCKEPGDILSSFPKSAIGLTPDHIKKTSQYKEARMAYDKASATLRKYNTWYTKAYENEIRADLIAKRNPKTYLLIQSVA